MSLGPDLTPFFEWLDVNVHPDAMIALLIFMAVVGTIGLAIELWRRSEPDPTEEEVKP